MEVFYALFLKWSAQVLEILFRLQLWVEGPHGGNLELNAFIRFLLILNDDASPPPYVSVAGWTGLCSNSLAHLMSIRLAMVG
eukprot:7113814-Karenia_brevis.AAC.1